MSITLNILGTGSYLPTNEVSSKSLEKKFDLSEGSLTQKVGIQKRHYADPAESTSSMAAKAVKKALVDSHLKAEDLDLIICASAVPEQAIPATSVLLQKELGLENHGTPCFDVNTTCSSFLTAFNLASQLINSGQYKKIAIASAEKPSLGLNWSELHSWPLFGDGSAAIILGEGDQVEVLSYLHKTYSSGREFCQIKAGGTGRNFRSEPKAVENDFLFSMDGRRIFKMALQKMPGFMEEILGSAGVYLDDLDLVIPHQASGPSMKIMRQFLRIKEDRFYNIFSEYGNQVAASIPTAFDKARREGRVQKGNKVMLVGTAAGISMSGLILRF